MYNPQIETFIKVADAGSFNKAADELYITPTAVIKQINLLESSLDLVLFERTHRGLILTNAGKSLYQDAKYIIGYCKDSVVRAKKRNERGRKYYSYRLVAYNSCSITYANVAENSRAMPGYKI